MKLDFNKIIGLVAVSLGLSEFKAKSVTEEQEQKLTDQYGVDFTAKFKKAIAAEDPKSAEAALEDSLRLHFADEASATSASVAQQLTAALAENKKKDQLIATLMASPEDLPAPEHVGASNGSAQAFKINKNAGHYSAVFNGLNNHNLSAADGQTIDVVDASSEFKSFLSSNGTNLGIIRQIFNGFTSAKYFRTIRTGEVHRATSAHINSVVQKFSKKWTPKGIAKFTPIAIHNRHHKINVPIIPADVLDTYLSFLYDESKRPDEMPITKYIWEQLVYPKILDDIEFRMIFKGKYVESTDPNSATDPEESMDGIETILVKEKASNSSSINFFTESINWDTATDAQVVKFVNDFSDFVDDKLKIKQIFASAKVKRRYQRAYDSLYKGKSGITGEINKDAIVDYGEKTIVALDGMDGSPILYATTPENKVVLMNKNTAPYVINDVQRHDYEVRLYGEFWLGAGFEIGELVFAYVPANYDPQAALNPSDEYNDGTSPGGSSDDGGL